MSIPGRNMMIGACMGVFLFGSLTDLSVGNGSPSPMEKRHQLATLYEQHGEMAMPDFAEAIGHESRLVRRKAAELLARFGSPAYEALREASRDRDYEVRRIAWMALRVTGHPVDPIELFLEDQYAYSPWTVQQILDDFVACDASNPRRAAFVSRLVRKYGQTDSSIVQHNLVHLLIAIQPSTDQARRLFAEAAEQGATPRIQIHCCPVRSRIMATGYISAPWLRRLRIP